jgi:hypothetical protein
LDARFEDLRRAVEDEVVRVRRDLLEELSHALSRMLSAPAAPDWKTAVAESNAVFVNDPLALDFLAKLAALTAPPQFDREPQGIDLRAQRFARVKVAEIQLYHAPAVKAGRAARDLYAMLQPQIDAARSAFQEMFLTQGCKITDYFHGELVRTLANEDSTLLGPTYPGPMA